MSFVARTSPPASSSSRRRKISCDRGCDHHDPVIAWPVIRPTALGSSLSCKRSRPCRSSAAASDLAATCPVILSRENRGGSPAQDGLAARQGVHLVELVLE